MAPGASTVAAVLEVHDGIEQAVPVEFDPEQPVVEDDAIAGPGRR